MFDKPSFNTGPSAPSNASTPEVQINFQSRTLPTGVTGLPNANAHTTSSRYEADVIVSGGVSGRFRGSIYPDNMQVKGRLLNGSYDLSLGFHKPGTPTAVDLKVRTNGFRAVLVINGGQSVPVSSLSEHKRSSDGVHIHNGYNHWSSAHPMSEGCLLIAPSDWSHFLNLFLTAFPNVSDWSTNGSRVGRRIGTVSVSSFVYNDLIPSTGTALA